MKHIHSFLLQLALCTFFLHDLSAQALGPSITQHPGMPWGSYWKGSTDTTNYKFRYDDLVDQIIYDGSYYFVGKTSAPQSTAQFHNCATNVNMGDVRDAYISSRDLCGNTWTTFFGSQYANEYAYCIAEDKAGSKKFFLHSRRN